MRETAKFVRGSTHLRVGVRIRRAARLAPPLVKPAAPPAKVRGPQPERLLTVAVVADRLSLSKESVYRFVRRGRLAGVKAGSALRIRASSVEAFIAGKR
jgi:excisionase family DNA binding protein